MPAQRAIRPGMPVEDLETPVLIIDLDIMERNLATMMGILDGSGVRLRPHLKTAKSPAIAHLMIQAGAVGICCAKLAEAEVMANAGITNILLTSEVAGAGTFDRLTALAARLPDFKAVVDNAWAVEQIACRSRARGITAKLLIELDVLTGRSGQATPGGTLALADLIRDTDGVELVGVHGYAGHAQIQPLEERQTRNDKAMALLRETVELLREHNHDIPIVTGGGSGTAAMDVQNGILNEVQAGSFLLMDVLYRNTGIPFENALFCHSTIISRPTAERAVCDAGGKTLSSDGGPPELIGRPGVRYVRGSDEHGSIAVDPAVQDQELCVGDVVTLLPSHVCTTVNLHDLFVGARRGKVETIWPIETRGHIW
ncbi:MAG TPA: DSD1 family PLP-dependent enzyme [Thermomicrobiales bacterium]|nr:DSD1 family PLP-dependent enzyme [Thermomicrobiales bacterium]